MVAIAYIVDVVVLTLQQIVLSKNSIDVGLFYTFI